MLYGYGRAPRIVSLLALMAGLWLAESSLNAAEISVTSPEDDPPRRIAGPMAAGALRASGLSSGRSGDSFSQGRVSADR